MEIWVDPLVVVDDDPDVQARVVGVNVAIAAEAQAIEFAIMVERLQWVLDVYRKTGDLLQPRFSLGFQFQLGESAIVEHLLQFRDEDKANGVLISSVCPVTSLSVIVAKPENQSLRMPMTQLFENLKLLVENSKSSCVRKRFTIEEFDDVVEALFDRAVLFATLHLSEDDCDLVDYRLPTTDKDERDLFKTNYLFLSEMRLYFDTLFEHSARWKSQRANMDTRATVITDGHVTEQRLKAFLQKYCQNFEREHFLEQFADYVLDTKLNSRLLTQLYRNKYPEVLRPDARRIVKHFRGVGALVDYSNIQYISDLFKGEAVEFAYEFALLFYLRMIHEEDPFSDGKEKKGFMVQNPMNPDKYTYYTRESDTFTPYASFLATASHYFNAGHSAVRDFAI